MNFGDINQVVAVGSVDGVCTAAAVLRILSDASVGLAFCQAFTVDKVNVEAWAPGRKVVLVDLAVNNRDPSMTVAFVSRLRAAGHQLVAVIDEHSREDWLSVLGSFDGLIVEPQSQKAEGGPGSSGEVLRRWLAAHDTGRFLCGGCGTPTEEENEYCPWGGASHGGADYFPEIRLTPVKETSTGWVLFGQENWGGDAWSQLSGLLVAAAAADRMDFTTHFGAIVNSAVKSSIADDSRRVYLTRHFGFNREPDERILAWIREYEVILANHDRVVASKVDLGNGIYRVTATGVAVDMTTLMARLYKGGARVVVLEGEAYNKALGKKTLQVSFGTADKGFDLLAAVKAAVPSASGFAQKANVDPTDEQAALAAIRAALTK